MSVCVCVFLAKCQATARCNINGFLRIQTQMNTPVNKKI